MMSDAGIIYSLSNFVHLTIISQFCSIQHFNFGLKRDFRHTHPNLTDIKSLEIRWKTLRFKLIELT